MPAIKISVVLIALSAIQCVFAGRISDASSYSNQFQGDYESNESSEHHQQPQYYNHQFNRRHDQHHFNDYDYESSQESFNTRTTTTIFPQTRHPQKYYTTTTPSQFPTTTNYRASKTTEYPSSYFYPSSREKIWESFPLTIKKSPKSNEIFPQDEQQDKPVFSYDENDEYGPTKWHRINQQCSGNFQSPIALHIKNASVDKNSQPLTIEGMDANPTSIKVENNGHSMKISFNYTNNRRVRFIGGPLQVYHFLDSVHWHWAKSDRAGSEHTLNSKRFAAEMHMVTYNSNYDSFATAATQPKGLAVLGVFYNLDNLNYLLRRDNKWSTLATRVIEAKSTYIEEKNLFTVRDLIQHDKFELITYRGSLTTPNCTENVQWMLSSRPLSIASSELTELRKLKDEKGRTMIENFRPLQNDNGREVVVYI